MTATVQDNPSRSRFEILVDGRVVGFAEYVLDGPTVEFTHTEVTDELEGRGLARQLAAEALTRARETGLDVLPSCPYIAKFIRRNPEYADLVPAERRVGFRL